MGVGGGGDSFIAAASKVQKESDSVGSQRNGNWDMTEEGGLLGCEAEIQPVPPNGQTGGHGDWKVLKTLRRGWGHRMGS